SWSISRGGSPAAIGSGSSGGRHTGAACASPGDTGPVRPRHTVGARRPGTSGAPCSGSPGSTSTTRSRECSLRADQSGGGQRRQRAAGHVVAAGELVRALDGDDVAGLLDDADDRAVAALVLADAAARAVGEVEAHLAQADALLDLADRVGQGVGVAGRLAQDV